MTPAAVRRRAWAARSSATAPSTSRTSSSGGWTRPVSSTISHDNVGAINARLAAVGYPGFADHDRHLSQPGAHHQFAREGGSQVSGRDQFERSLQLVRRRRPSNSRGAGGVERAQRLGRAGQHRSDRRGQQHHDAVAADGQRNPGAVRVQRSEGAARPIPIGPAVSIAGVASFGTLSGSPTAAREQDVPGRRQPLAPGGRARAAGRRRLPLQRRHHHLSRDRSAAAYTFSSLANFLSGTYNNAGFTQTFGATVGLADQSESRRLRAGRMEGQSRADAERRAALRPAVPGNDQHRHQQRLAARSGSPGRRLRRRRTVVRGSAGLFYDRVPLRAVANALLSAGNTTDLSKLRQISVSLSPDAGRRAGVPEHPDRRRAVGHAGQLDDDGSRTCRTPIPGRAASRSSSSSASAAPSASATSICAG